MAAKQPLAELSEEQILLLARDPEALANRAAQIAAARDEAKRAAQAAARAKTTAAMIQGRERMAPSRRKSTGVPWYDQLSDEEQMRAIAEANLRAYGTLVPPREVVLSDNLEKVCPKCGISKPLLSGFGVRVQSGVLKAQSNCIKCRRESDLHKRNPY